MVLTRNVAKRHQIEECKPYMESVLFSRDSLFKIASYLPTYGLLNLALTCSQFGSRQISDAVDNTDCLSLMEETARRLVHDVARGEEMNALPCHDGYNWLSKYNYLRLLRAPLTFDQLVGKVEYLEGNKSCVINRSGNWCSAISNSIMMAGKHYVSFEACDDAGSRPHFRVGIMRPGEVKQSARYTPESPMFYDHFTQHEGSEQYNNSVNCCMYCSYDGACFSHDWESLPGMMEWREEWRVYETSPHQFGMLLDFDEGTLSVYNNGRRLGVMKGGLAALRGLAGHYCWVVALPSRTQVTMKRGPVPAN
jgi:hypothetical protein